MKHNTRLVSALLVGASLIAGITTASAHSPQQNLSGIVPPAVNNGSNFSRAPFLAVRQYDAITTAPSAQTVSSEPVLTPTGRMTVATAPSVAPTFNTTSAYRNTSPVVPPAVNNGSNFSRAPIPSARQFDDTKGPDGQAIDSAR